MLEDEGMAKGCFWKIKQHQRTHCRFVNFGFHTARKEREKERGEEGEGGGEGRERIDEGKHDLRVVSTPSIMVFTYTIRQLSLNPKSTMSKNSSMEEVRISKVEKKKTDVV